LIDFDITKKWILSSGLVVSNSENENLGGVHSYYDEKQQNYGFLYPEITGYFLSTLNFLNNIENNTKYVELSKNSANWLMSIYEKYGGIIQGIYDNNNQKKFVYSFDIGICSNGILDCYKLTKENKYLDFAQTLLSWITNEAIQNNGKIQSVKDLESNKFFEEKKYWYKQYGCLHLKTSMTYLKMYQLTKNQSDLTLGKKILNQYSLFQKNDGSFSLHENDSVVHIHSLCYALEGLIFGYYITKEKNYLKICEDALKWCSSKIENDGSMNLWFNSSNPSSKTSYQIAQLIRLMILCDKATGNEIFHNDIEKLFNFMKKLHVVNGSQKILGGFYEEFYKSFLKWKLRYNVNSWGTLFALQSIYFKENYDSLSFEESVEYLF